MKRLKLSNKKDKLEFIIYLVNYFLIFVFMLTLLGFIGLFIFSLFYGLTNISSRSIISIAICLFLLYQSFNYSRFLEIRKKFNNQLFIKRVKSEDKK